MDLQLMKIRKRAGYKNRDDFADRIGVNRYTYRSWESGAAMMSLEQAYNVTEVLGCTLEELVGRSQPRERFGDPDQEALNGYYESMNGGGRTALVESARLMSGSPDVRIEKDR